MYHIDRAYNKSLGSSQVEELSLAFAVQPSHKSTRNYLPYYLSLASVSPTLKTWLGTLAALHSRRYTLLAALTSPVNNGTSDSLIDTFVYVVHYPGSGCIEAK